LCGCREQDFVSDAAQALQPEPVEPENALHVCKSYLNLLALAARLSEGFGVGQCADTVTHIFVNDIAVTLTRRQSTTSWSTLKTEE
jgi:hypothetical protein